MERRCILCSEVISEEEINGAIDYALWEEFGRQGGEVYDEGGQPQPPEGANWEVTCTERLGWVHYYCQLAYGSGLTPTEIKQQFLEGLRHLCDGQEEG
jgi:hypothetical protein